MRASPDELLALRAKLKAYQDMHRDPSEFVREREAQERAFNALVPVVQAPVPVEKAPAVVACRVCGRPARRGKRTCDDCYALSRLFTMAAGF